MSDSASAEPKEITRHIVVHQRRTPFRRFKRLLTRLSLILTASFLVTSIVVDLLHPRTLKSGDVSTLATLLRNNSDLSSHLLTKTSIPSRHAFHQTTTAITGNPPVLITRQLLYWTPVESLTLLTYPSSPPVIHHAVSVNLHLYPLSELSITRLRSQSTRSTQSIPRFTPFVIHPQKHALILEHADGFLPARNLQTAIYAAAITMHPRLLYDAFKENTALLLAYFRRCLPTIALPEPLGWARRISDIARERRMKRINLSAKEP